MVQVAAVVSAGERVTESDAFTGVAPTAMTVSTPLADAAAKPLVRLSWALKSSATSSAVASLLWYSTPPTTSVKLSPAIGVGIVMICASAVAGDTVAAGVKLTVGVNEPPVPTRCTIVSTGPFAENAKSEMPAVTRAFFRASATAVGPAPAATSAKALPSVPPRLTVQRPASFACVMVTSRET